MKVLVMKVLVLWFLLVAALLTVFEVGVTVGLRHAADQYKQFEYRPELQ